MLVLALVSCVLCSGSVPPIPAGRRAEYYLLQDDGAYKFGYDTGEGQSASASADPANQVQGRYSYVDNKGQRVSLSYTAGDTGFVPQLEGGGSRVASVSSIGSSAAGYQASASSSFGSDASQVDADYDANADASYAFSIDTDSYKRTESSDAKGNVRGQYSYSSKAGGSHSLSYVAGEGTGFVASSTGVSNDVGLPNNAYVPAASAKYSGPAANTRSKINEDGSYAFSFSTDDQSRDESADSHNNVRGSYSFKSKDDGQIRRVDYTAGAAGGFVASGAHIPVPPSPVSSFGPSSPTSYSSVNGASLSAATSQSVANNDGSYSFSYNAGDSTRQESADAQNNVKGSFAFKAKDDGQTRRVDYEAGPRTGFVAKGSHLPVSPSVPVNSFEAPSGGFSSRSPVVSTYAGTPSGSDDDEGPSGDASYSFSYNTGDHSREESSDSQGNVKGRFSYVAKDGVQRNVDYTAGAGKGFVAKGAHLPVASSKVAFGQSSSGYSSSASSSSHASHASSYSSNSFASANTASSAAAAGDGSYSFSYNAGDHSRQESADSQNNVRGSFSFKAKDDGQTRHIDYEAGPATGFIAKGAHLPVAQSSVAVGVYASVPSASTITSYATSLGGSPSAGVNRDGSYSFAYNTADQSRHEAGDSQNNIRGSYSFKAKDDGQTRRVDYEAGAVTGFVAKGTHLPVAPSVSATGVSPYSQPFSSSPFSGSSSSTFVKSLSPDGSYSFSYNAGDHSREESADSRGNVRGRFYFTAKDDGKARQLDYEAGAEKGFVAKGAHLPVSPVTPGSVSAASSAVGYQALSAFKSVVADSSNDEYNNGNAAYSYSYQTDSSGKQESSDALGNVKGSFSFLGGDGVSRSVQYTAKGNEGFVASGAHLPKEGSNGAANGISTLASTNVASVGSFGGYAAATRSSQGVKAENFRLQKYLPPESPHKYGYIFDTKV